MTVKELVTILNDFQDGHNVIIKDHNSNRETQIKEVKWEYDESAKIVIDCEIFVPH